MLTKYSIVVVVFFFVCLFFLFFFYKFLEKCFYIYVFVYDAETEYEKVIR